MAGQLLMVGLSSGSGDPGLDETVALVRSHHVGSVVLEGDGWRGAGRVRAASAALQAAAGADAGPGLFVSGNQEGGGAGSFQAFFGPGFSPIPPALAQARLAPPALEDQALAWGRQLREAGVNLDLGPVMDVVPEPGARDNQPIGRYEREYGHDPATVSSHGGAVVRGLTLAGVQAAVKHFPGLGRVPQNTDLHATGISDPQTRRHGPYLRPFQAGIEAGAGFVMVSLARYPGLDPAAQAVFSPVILRQVLRGDLGFRGVILSDDLGAAAVASLLPGDRALRFIQAGGDLALTVRPADVPQMAAALTGRMSTDAGFRALAREAAGRVLTAKAASGLVDCVSGAPPGLRPLP